MTAEDFSSALATLVAKAMKAGLDSGEIQAGLETAIDVLADRDEEADDKEVED